MPPNVHRLPTREVRMIQSSRSRFLAKCRPRSWVGEKPNHPVAEDGACAGPIDVAPAREPFCRHR
jgi:hypothetical protein